MPAVAVPVRLHAFDLGLIVVYLVGITLFGLRFRNGRAGGGGRSLRSYFLADQRIPWWAIALSIVSAETSTLTIISVPGVAFAGDFGFLQVVMGYMLGRIVVATLFLPRYFQGQMLTAYQLIDQRFGRTLHKVTAGLFLLTRAAAEGVRVFAVSIVVGIAIGTGDVLSIGIISALTLLYTFEGGMTAVIWTDVVQMTIYIAGTVVAISTLGSHVPGGWSLIHQVAGAAGKFHLFHFALNLTQTYTFWAGVVGGTFLTMASHGTDQLMVQRMLAARSLRESRLALLSSGVVILLQFTLFLLIGAGLYVFYGLHPATFRTNDYIFPSFIVREMPVGVAGLLIAAILAAAMSNLSAALNSLSSTTVVDFYMHWRPQAEERERMMISRSSTVLWAIVLFAVAVYAVFAGGKGHVVEVGLSIASVAYGALLGVFLLGTLTRYATQAGAIAGMAVGFALNIALWMQSGPIHLQNLPLVGDMTLPHVAWTWYVFIGAVVTFAVGSVASILLPGRSRAQVVAAGLILMVAVDQMAVPARAEALADGKRAGSQMGEAAADFSPITTLISQAIVAKKLPGAVVLINHNGKTVFEQAYGERALEPAIEHMTEDTIFDMASLTKCLVTATAVMQLYEAGKVQFDAPVAKYLPEFAANGKEKVTVRELLTHYSGLPADVDLKAAWTGKQAGLELAFNSRLETTPGTAFKYSDINYIVLGALVEKLSGEPLERYAAKHIFQPLGMVHTRYLPPAEWIANIAPTAHNDDGPLADDKLLRGTVHDPTTRRMGGVAGHAGVFSTAADLKLYAQALLDKLLHDAGPFPLKQSTLVLMTKPQQPVTAQPGATVFAADGKPATGVAVRGFGWDINTGFSRPRGEVFPVGSFGHTGFTGTSMWMDPGSNTFVILLANAVHPRGNPPISALRGQVATAAARALALYPQAVTTQTPAPCSKGMTECSASPHNPSFSTSPEGGVTNAPPSGSGVQPQADVDSGNGKTLTGIGVLEQSRFAELAEVTHRHNDRLRVGLLTNQTGLDAQGRRTIDVLKTDAEAQVAGLKLTTLFSPEHGILGTKDSTDVASEMDAKTDLPVISLYGPKDSDRRPSHDALKNLDAVMIDLQDAGVRFYTYETVVGYFLEAAAAEKAAGHELEVVVLDRPNPIGGVAVQGPVSDAGLESYTNYMPMPVRNGLTLGELARYFNGERRRASPTSANVQVPMSARLTVVPMQGWKRSQYFDETGLPWTNPSPNLRSVTAAVLYPGVELLEMTNVSVGRGTATPFEHIGAPYIDGAALASYLTKRKIAGVSFAATTFEVTEDANHYPSHGKRIPGIAFTLTDRKVLDAPELGIELISALHYLYPAQFNFEKAERLVANVNTMLSLKNNEDPQAIASAWKPEIEAFKRKREGYLLYQ